MKILVTTDGSEGSEKAIRFASKMASESGSSITLLHVIPKIKTTKEDVIILLKEEIGSSKKAGKKYLEEGSKVAGEFGIKPETKLLEGKEVVDEIIKESDNYDLIVAGSYGKGKVDEFLLGSVSSKLVHKSKVPVLVVK
jgi:nucleotide-binding universal stress UspA family protein